MDLVKTIWKDKVSATTFLILVIVDLILFILWRHLIQDNELPIYSPIKIFPVQYSFLISAVNSLLAVAISSKSIRTSHLLLATALFVSIISVVMVLYSYSFFNI